MGGGKGGTRRSNGGGSGETSCDDIDFETTLLSPHADSLRGISVGDILEVSKVDDDKTGPSLVVVTLDGRVVGSVISNIFQIVKCSGQGYGYLAEVLSIEGGACRVRIYSRGAV